MTREQEMGNISKRSARRALAVVLAAALAMSMMPAGALAQTSSASAMGGAAQAEGTSASASPSVGSAPVQQGLADGDTISTSVAVAVWSSFHLTTEPGYLEFRNKAQLIGDDRFLVSAFEGGSRIEGAPDGLPYESSWARERWDKAAKAYVAEQPGEDTFTSTTTCDVAEDGMVMRYDLTADEFASDTRYRYTLTARDAAGIEQVNQVEVFCGNRYIFDPVEGGTSRGMSTWVSVSALRLWDSYLGVEELPPEARNELYPLVGGYVMDSASNVSLTSDTATEEEPAYVVPPEMALTIRLNDQDVQEGTPVRVVSVQEGRARVVSEPDARVEVQDGYKVARVGSASADMAHQTGVAELGIFAVAYAPAGGTADQMRVTSQVGRVPGQASPQGAVVPASAAQLYASGQTIRYTFLPEYGWEVAHVTVGPDADGAKNPAVDASTPGCALGLNFLDYTVPTPAAAGADHMYVTVFYKASEMPGPVDPTDPDDPDDPLNRGYAVVAMAADDLPGYDGRGQVRIVGASDDDVDDAGNPRVYVLPTKSATIELIPDANSVLAHVTVQQGSSAPQEASVLGSHLVLPSITSDTTVRAYFKHGAHVPRTELDITYDQNVDASECGWELTGTSDTVFYGDPLTVMVERTGDAADGWQLASLTVNGEDVLERAEGSAARALAGDGASARASAGAGAGHVSYYVDYVVRDTDVAAVFEEKSPTDPDDPNNPGGPGGPDDPNNPGGSDDPGNSDNNGNGDNDSSGDIASKVFTVRAYTAGHGIIEPAGERRVQGGSRITFRTKPEIGYRAAQIKVADASGERTIPHTSTAYTHVVTGDCTVTAVFAAQPVPASDSAAARTIRRLRSLAQTGDLNLPIALALAATAAAGAGIALIVRRRRDEEEPEAA